MTPWWSSVTWEVARAGGFAAYFLLTLAMGLGLALSLRLQSAARWPRLINNELHQYLLLLSGVFTVVHGLAAWLDPFTKFTAAEVLLPGASHYRPLWMALGIIAAYLGIAVGITTWLRPRIGYNWWRRFHYATFLVWALATVHGLATGSDTQTTWAQAIYAGSTCLVMGLLALRFLIPVTKEGARHPGWVVAMALLTLGGTAWAAKGPTQAGWNSVANNGQGSGARVPLSAPGTLAPAQPTTPTYGWARQFTASYQGTIATAGPDNSGRVTLTFDGALGNQVGGKFVVTLVGVPVSRGIALSNGIVQAGPNTSQLVYQGNLTQLNGQNMEAQVTNAAGQTWNVAIVVNISPDNQNFTGQVQGTAVTASSIRHHGDDSGRTDL